MLAVVVAVAQMNQAVKGVCYLELVVMAVVAMVVTVVQTEVAQYLHQELLVLLVWEVVVVVALVLDNMELLLEVLVVQE
jgi:hypothetical protein